MANVACTVALLVFLLLLKSRQYHAAFGRRCTTPAYSKPGVFMKSLLSAVRQGTLVPKRLRSRTPTTKTARSVNRMHPGTIRSFPVGQALIAKQSTKPLRVLHVISSADRRGGGPIEGILQINRALQSLGHESELVTPDPPDAPWLAEFPMPITALGGAKFSYRYSPHLVPWLMENASRYDCLIVNGLWQFHGLAVRQAALRLGVPYFVYTHGMLDPWFKRAFPLKHLKKLLYWHWNERRILRDAAAVCFTSEEERRLARHSFGCYHASEVVVNYGTSVPAGDPDTQREMFLSRWPHLREQRLLLFLSRIHAKKGCDLLLEAFARAVATDPSLHLVMAGPDQTGWQAKLEAQAQKLGIAEHITWTGMLSGEMKWGAFRAAEAFALPSHQENFGIAVAEALACGVPVLISDKVNIWREIEQSGAGLVAPDTKAGTSDLLQRWLCLSEQERQVMGCHAAECFAEHFEIHQAAQSLLDVLASVGVGRAS